MGGSRRQDLHLLHLGAANNNELRQAAGGGRAGTLSVLVNAQLSPGEEGGWRCGKTPPPTPDTGRHTAASLSLPFLFPLRSAGSSVRERTHPSAPRRGFPPTPRPQDTTSTPRPLSPEEKGVPHAIACTLGPAQLRGHLFADPTGPQKAPAGRPLRRGPEEVQGRTALQPQAREDAILAQGRLWSMENGFGNFFFFFFLFHTSPQK